MRKYEIVNHLARRRRLRRLLEISTPTTGVTFEEADGRLFEVCDRLAYALPDSMDDRQPYTYGTADRTSASILKVLLAASERGLPRYDVVFVDPFHTYRCSSIDLTGAFALLAPGGVMVVHDCNPPTAELATPDYEEGGWCGLTYAAFLDLVLTRAGLSYYTVDCDYGCGVVFKQPARATVARPPDAARDALAFEWDAARHEDPARFRFFERNRKRLLNLISEAEFAALEGVARELKTNTASPGPGRATVAGDSGESPDRAAVDRDQDRSGVIDQDQTAEASAMVAVRSF